MITVSIGIQARSTSQRLPNKALLNLDGKPLLQHVLERCEKSASYINRTPPKRLHMMVGVSLLIPQGDPIGQVFRHRVHCMEGDERDVLSRYLALLQAKGSDYLVRITGDCPFIPSHIITKHITAAVNHSLDYLSNVDERYRTAPDGWDCEVISRRALEWLRDNAQSPSEREHVTTRIRPDCPTWMKLGFIVDHVDLSHLKFSVDSFEDYERVKEEVAKIERKLKAIEELYGKTAIFRF
jgi:spore coat polysaccharide biosynthesis protein SpsF